MHSFLCQNKSDMNRFSCRRCSINLFWIVIYSVFIGYVIYANYYGEATGPIDEELVEIIKEFNQTQPIKPT